MIHSPYRYLHCLLPSLRTRYKPTPAVLLTTATCKLLTLTHSSCPCDLLLTTAVAAQRMGPAQMQQALMRKMQMWRVSRNNLTPWSSKLQSWTRKMAMRGRQLSLRLQNVMENEFQRFFLLHYGHAHPLSLSLSRTSHALMMHSNIHTFIPA